MGHENLKTHEKTNSLRYLVTQFDQEGWADATSSFPIPFDLVLLQTNTAKKICGWWNELSWEGLYLKDGERVIKWKRRRYEQIT